LTARNLGKTGWSCGVAAGDSDGLRDDGKRFVIRTDEKLTAFAELESAVSA
jgi:hypothetical protein